MFNNFHWGHGITIFYTIFVIAVGTVLYASFGVDMSLVADDYYAQDLAFQDQYDKIQNAIKDSVNRLEVNVLSEEEIIEVLVPTDKPLDGKIFFYRPSDQTKDFSIDLVSSRSLFSTSSLQKGKWILKMEWNDGTKPFYQERQIYIP